MSEAAVKPDTTQLAMERTWLANERTLMAWVRTATSMITFGFTIYKFFQFEVGRGERATLGLLTPRDFALIMVSIGLVALLAATVSHRKQVGKMTAALKRRFSIAEVVAMLVSLFGFAVLLSAIFRE